MLRWLVPLLFISNGLLSAGCADSTVESAADAPLSISDRGADDASDMFQADSALPQDDAARPATPGRTAFSFPIHPEDRDQIQATLVIGVDHDPGSDGALDCRSYAGDSFPACYDGHDGTDFLVWGGFDTVDARDIRVVAAAPGVVTRVEDGHYDRCHGDFRERDVSCDGHPVRSNRVHLRHRDGVESQYLHLKAASIQVEVGAMVDCGDVIAHVGSSGRSTTPHLHFEVLDVVGDVVDPYAGPVTRPDSYWVEQDAGDGLPGTTCGL